MMLGDTTLLLLLRHGQSEWNAVRRWQGMADSQLTELGRAQAAETSLILDRVGHDFESVWASDLGRASETASIIAESLNLGPVSLEPRLREAHAGEWEGFTRAEIELDWPGYLARERRPPSFESFDSLVERALAALRDIAAASAGDDAMLAVTHSGLIRAVVRHIVGHDENIANLGGVWLEIAPSAKPTGPLDTTGISVGSHFDPAGIVVSGIDTPNEGPTA